MHASTADVRALSASFLRFAAVGVLANVGLYLGYLALTRAGLGHKVAMTLVFVVGTLATFVANRSWSFRSRAPAAGALARYAATYVAAYVVNLAALVMLVDRMGWRHELVQGAMVLVVAMLTFVAQRYWVFGTADGARDRP